MWGLFTSRRLVNLISLPPPYRHDLRVRSPGTDRSSSPPPRTSEREESWYQPRGQGPRTFSQTGRNNHPDTVDRDPKSLQGPGTQRNTRTRHQDGSVFRLETQSHLRTPPQSPIEDTDPNVSRHHLNTQGLREGVTGKGVTPLEGDQDVVSQDLPTDRTKRGETRGTQGNEGTIQGHTGKPNSWTCRSQVNGKTKEKLSHRTWSTKNSRQNFRDVRNDNVTSCNFIKEQVLYNVNGIHVYGSIPTKISNISSYEKTGNIYNNIFPKLFY